MNFKKIFHKVNNLFMEKVKLTDNIKQKLGRNTLNIFDVGAVGIPEKNKFNFALDKNFTKIYKVDDILNKENLPNEVYLWELLWSKNEEKDFYLTKNKVSSSLYKPNFEILDKFKNFDDHTLVKQKKVFTKSVSGLSNIDKLDFVKLDAEGAELEILKGFDKKIEELMGIEIEVQFIERYIESPLFFEVNKFLNDNGFELYLINSESWFRGNKLFNSTSNHKLVWADLVYFRKLELIKKNCKEKVNSNYIEKLVILLILYRFYDESIFILKELTEEKLISYDLRNDLEILVKKNLLSNTKIIFKALSKIIFATFILIFTVFFLNYRKRGYSYFKNSLKNFFDKLAGLVKTDDQNRQIIRENKL